jgi:hypothetical protein
VRWQGAGAKSDWASYERRQRSQRACWAARSGPRLPVGALGPGKAPHPRPGGRRTGGSPRASGAVVASSAPRRTCLARACSAWRAGSSSGCSRTLGQ